MSRCPLTGLASLTRITLRCHLEAQISGSLETSPRRRTLGKRCRLGIFDFKKTDKARASQSCPAHFSMQNNRRGNLDQTLCTIMMSLGSSLRTDFQGHLAHRSGPLFRVDIGTFSILLANWLFFRLFLRIILMRGKRKSGNILHPLFINREKNYSYFHRPCAGVMSMTKGSSKS